MGLVSYQSQWKTPEEVARDLEDDPGQKARVDEYLDRRAKVRDRADDLWKLALWCEQNGLKQQATAHLFEVLKHDPRRDAAWKRLGFKKLGGHWDKPERLAAAKAEAELQRKANKHWIPMLQKWRGALASHDQARRAETEKALAAIADPRAVPAIWAVFVLGGQATQKTAVNLLAQIDAPGSSCALAMIAVLSRTADVRRDAVRVLKNRDPRDYAALLIALLRDPIKYDVKGVTGPGSRGELTVKSKTGNVKRLYTPLAAPSLPLLPNDAVALDANGLPVVVRDMGTYMVGASVAANSAFSSTPMNVPTVGALLAAQVRDLQIDIPIGQMTVDAQRSAQMAKQQLAGDVQAIEAYNAPIIETNQRVSQVLAGAIGANLGADRTSWEKWFVDLCGYAYSARRSYDQTTTVVEQVPLSYQPRATPVIVDQQVSDASIRHSCFGAGTLVRTLDGLREIETLRTGDQVLTADIETGALKYQPLLEVYHNPPNATFRIELYGESIVATGIHRLWKAGTGWTMVRDLKPGDSLRRIGGVAVVKSVDKERVQPVFNLHVAEGQNFFVGRAGVLRMTTAW